MLIAGTGAVSTLCHLTSSHRLRSYISCTRAIHDQGPIVATIFAVRELLAAGKLDHLNIVFLYEGEEESSSVGFRDVVQRLHASGWLGGHGRSEHARGSPVQGVLTRV